MKEFLKNDRFAAMAGVELLEVERGYAKHACCSLPTT